MSSNYAHARSNRRLGRKFRKDAYYIPNYVREAIKRNDLESLNLQTCLNFENYVDRLKNLLWVEQLWEENEIKTYDLYNRKIEHRPDGLYYISIHDFKKISPMFLFKAHSINLSSAGETPFNDLLIIEKWGFDEVSFKSDTLLNCQLHYNLSFNCKFTHSSEHIGVDNYRRVNELNLIVFPEPNPGELRNSIEIEDNFTCLNGDLNHCQRKAVVNILRAQARPAPHLLLGGPGTGKSRVIVEAVLQIYLRIPEAMVLVCASTNSCADLLATMIFSSGFIQTRSHIARIASVHRAQKEVDDDLRPIFIERESIPSMIDQLRILVTTSNYSSVLHRNESRFDYVFIEEIGRLTEPEALIPIGLIDRHIPSSVVLAGDPQHLKPVVKSPIAVEAGRATSMLERLLQLPMYDLESLPSGEAHSDNYLTKLITSYRSDPKIMQVCNELYYNNELQFINHTPQRWLDVLNVDNPTIFHPVYGQDALGEAGNWFNEKEADVVMDYVQKLYSAGLQADQLGIISGHRAQVNKLKSRFVEEGLDSCMMGSIEEFSGKEKCAVIISATRTSPDQIDSDRLHERGFLLDSSMFISAISRAKWILIVVGHPEILKQDANWLKFIDQAQTVDTETNQTPN